MDSVVALSDSSNTGVPEHCTDYTIEPTTGIPSHVDRPQFDSKDDMIGNALRITNQSVYLGQGTSTAPKMQRKRIVETEPIQTREHAPSKETLQRTVPNKTKARKAPFSVTKKNNRGKLVAIGSAMVSSVSNTISNVAHATCRMLSGTKGIPITPGVSLRKGQTDSIRSRVPITTTTTDSNNDPIEPFTDDDDDDDTYNRTSKRRVSTMHGKKRVYGRDQRSHRLSNNPSSVSPPFRNQRQKEEEEVICVQDNNTGALSTKRREFDVRTIFFGSAERFNGCIVQVDIENRKFTLGYGYKAHAQRYACSFSDIKWVRYHYGQPDRRTEIQRTTYLSLRIKVTEENNLNGKDLGNAYLEDPIGKTREERQNRSFIVIEFETPDQLRNLLGVMLLAKLDDINACIESGEIDSNRAGGEESGMLGKRKQKMEVDKTKVDKTKVDKTKVDKTKVDKTKVDKTKVDKMKVDKMKVDSTTKESTLRSGRKLRSGNRRCRESNDENTFKKLLVFPFDGDQQRIDQAADGLKISQSVLAARDKSESFAKSTSNADNAFGFDGSDDEEPEEQKKRTTKRAHYLTIRGGDRDRLAPEEYLNDTLIDFWMQW